MGCMADPVASAEMYGLPLQAKDKALTWAPWLSSDASEFFPADQHGSQKANPSRREFFLGNMDPLVGHVKLARGGGGYFGLVGQNECLRTAATG